MSREEGRKETQEVYISLLTLLPCNVFYKKEGALRRGLLRKDDTADSVTSDEADLSLYFWARCLYSLGILVLLIE